MKLSERRYSYAHIYHKADTANDTIYIYIYYKRPNIAIHIYIYFSFQKYVNNNYHDQVKNEYLIAPWKPMLPYTKKINDSLSCSVLFHQREEYVI